MKERPGVHQRATYIALVYGLHQARRTGVLEVRSGRAWRRLYFVAGNVVWYASDKVEEELGRSLLKAGLLSKSQLNTLLGSRSPFEPLDQRLLADGTVGPDQLREHRLQQLGPAVSAPLAWEGGEWSFDARDSLAAEAIDRALFPDCHVLQELWAGVPQFVQMEEALQALGAQGGRRLCPQEGLAATIGSLQLRGALPGLPEAVGSGASVEELFQRIPDRSGNLMQLLWFLFSCNALGHEDGAADEVKGLLARGKGHAEAVGIQQEQRRARDEKVARSVRKKAPTISRITASRAVIQEASSGISSKARRPAGQTTDGQGKAGSASKQLAGSRSSAKPSQGDRIAHLSRLIQTAHEHRMGKNFYAFLDLTKSSSSAEVRSAYERLSRGWRAASEELGLDESDYGRVQELLHAAKLVWQTLSDDNLREEYDERLAAGTAPLLDSQLELMMASARVKGEKAELKGRVSPKVTRKEAPGGPGHTQAREHMKRGDYRAALVPLREARDVLGSNPHVLADLGWCTWKVHGARIPQGEQENGEDLLLLAQTFDPDHAKTMEYLCRMAREKGDSDAALLWLNRLLKVYPRSRWGQKMAETLRAEGMKVGNVGRGG